MDALSKSSRYDIIWVEVDKCHYVVPRFLDPAVDPEYATSIRKIAYGSPLYLASAFATVIDLSEVLNAHIDKINEYYAKRAESSSEREI